MVGPRTNGLGGKEAVFFKLTKSTADGKLWQVFPTDNSTYILRTKAARTNAYLAHDSKAGSESEIIMRDVNGASDEVFWKINRFANGGYNLENVAKGTGWHLQAKDYENLTMTNNVAEQDNQKFQFTAFTDAGPINDPAFSSIKVSTIVTTIPHQRQGLISIATFWSNRHCAQAIRSDSITKRPTESVDEPNTRSRASHSARTVLG